MNWVRFTLTPNSPFGSPLRGDTLFGQFCWALRYSLGEAGLTHLLDGYRQNRPFLVVSDGFPSGFVPRPELPPDLTPSDEDRKAAKKRRWLPLAVLTRPITAALKDAQDCVTFTPSVQPHNSINRQTNTTGLDGFAPYQTGQLWLKAGHQIDIHVLHDADRLTLGDVLGLFKDIGQTGYGRDASIGLGRFDVDIASTDRPDCVKSPDAVMTLAPSAPQGGHWDAARCYWRPFTRFGRHGGVGAFGAPFKSPVLLADTGAVLVARDGVHTGPIIGRGLGGNGEISAVIPETIHQGYAPVLPIEVGQS